MENLISPADQHDLDAWLKESLVRRRLVEQQIALIDSMLLSQAEFQKALQENAAAMARAVSEEADSDFLIAGDQSASSSSSASS